MQSRHCRPLQRHRQGARELEIPTAGRQGAHIYSKGELCQLGAPASEMEEACERHLGQFAILNRASRVAIANLPSEDELLDMGPPRRSAFEREIVQNESATPLNVEVS